MNVGVIVNEFTLTPLPFASIKAVTPFCVLEQRADGTGWAFAKLFYFKIVLNIILF